MSGLQSGRATGGLLRLGVLLLTTASWAHGQAPPAWWQEVTVEVTHVRPRGPDLNRGQYFYIEFGGEREQFRPPHPCDGTFETCTPIFLDPPNCAPPASGGVPFVEVEATSSLTVPLLSCRSPEHGHIEVWHDFTNVGSVMVFSHPFDIDLTDPLSQHCAAIETGNAAGVRFEITATPPAVAADSDGDGFNDLDEVHGADTNCDGQADVVLNLPVAQGGLHDVPADPSVPDLYVEVDWMDCAIPQPGQTGTSCPGILDDLGNPDMRSFEPDWVALASVTQAFADHDINLHIMPGEGVPVMGRITPNRIDLSDTLDELDPTIQDGQLVWDLYFGEQEDRAPTAAARRQYKAAHIRYAIFNHGNQDGGYAWGGGDMFRVSHHSRYTYPYGGFWGEVLTAFDRARELGHGFMHELGHSLGLGHGGQDDSERKPNHFSVMTYRAPRLDDLATPWYDRVHNYSEIPDVLELCDLDENEPMVANAPTVWATTWTCPDIARRGSGSILGPNDYDCDGILGEVHTGSLFEGECMELREPLVCVNPGMNNILETVPGFDDQIMGGEIVPGVDGVLTTQVATDPAGNLLDTLVIVGGQLRIHPGLDGRLHSLADAGDVHMGGVILPGGNLWCDTEAVASDLQGFGLHAPNCDPDGTPGGIQPCDKVIVVDEWAILRFDLLGNVSGAYEGPPLTSPVEPTSLELADQARRSSRADVGLSSSVTTGSGPHGATTTFTYDLVNFGPYGAFDPTVQIRLPEGTELVRCETAGGPCLQHDGVVVVAPGDLAPGTTRSVEVQVVAGCDGTAAALEVMAEVSTVSFDPYLENNTTVEMLTIEPVLDIGQVGRPWVKSWTSGLPMPTAQTSAGQALVLTCGYQAFESPAFDTDDLGATATELWVDLFVPQGSWGSWVGNLELYFEAPGLNIWNRWLANQALTALPRGQWVTVAFPLDTATRNALAGLTPGARFRFASNLGGCGMAVHFANVRLGGDVTCHSEPAPAEGIVSTSVLRFESMADWTSSAGALALETAEVSEGAHALRVGPVPWTRLESRTVGASELGGVTSRFALEVLVPSAPPATSWVGGLGLVVDCPDAGLHDHWVGYHGLQFLFEEQFNRLEFALAPDVVSVLDTPGVECQFALELSSNPVVGSFVFDAGGFLPEVAP